MGRWSALISLAVAPMAAALAPVTGKGVAEMACAPPAHPKRATLPKPVSRAPPYYRSSVIALFRSWHTADDPPRSVNMVGFMRVSRRDRRGP